MQPAILIGGLDGDLAGPVYAHGSAFAVELIKTFTFLLFAWFHVFVSVVHVVSVFVVLLHSVVLDVILS